MCKKINNYSLANILLALSTALLYVYITIYLRQLEQAGHRIATGESRASGDEEQVNTFGPPWQINRASGVVWKVKERKVEENKIKIKKGIRAV